LDKGELIAYDTPLELKKIMEKALFELSCDKRREARSFLEKEEGVSGISIFGEKIHFTVKDEKILEEIKSMFKDNNIVIFSLKRIIPSLEDIFILLKQ